MNNQKNYNNKILLIDDDLEIWQSFQDVLVPIVDGGSGASQMFASLVDNYTASQETKNGVSSTSYRLSHAQQGYIGYEMVKKALAAHEPYALVFIDVRMPPGWHGVKTAKMIRQIDPDIEIVIITAFSDQPISEIVDTVGSVDKLLFLKKPFDPEELSQLALSLTAKWNLAKRVDEQRASLKGILAASPAAIFVLDEHDSVSSWNHAAERITGYKASDVIGKACPLKMYCGVERCRDLCDNLLADDVAGKELDIKDSRGERKIISLTAKSVAKGSDSTDKIIAFWDITSKKMTEEALKKAESHYRTIADFTYDWEYWQRGDGGFQYMSPSCERVSGYTQQEFMENPALLESIVLPEDKKIWKAHRNQASVAYGLRQAQFRIRKADGAIKWIEHACRPVIDNDGNFLGFRASNRDITERKGIENDLRQSKVMHEEAQSIAKIGHWRMDLREDTLRWSNEVYNIFGINKGDQEPDYEIFLKAIHPEDRQKVDKAFWDSVENRCEFDIVHRLLLTDGKIKYVHERCRTEYTESGEGLYSIGTVQDITDLKETEIEKENIEQRLRHSQKLEAIGTLAGGIAHDFNNLLNAIIGYSDLLLWELPRGGDYYNDIAEIKRAGKRAADLVRQILTFSRRGEREQEPLQLQFVVKEAIKLLRSSMPATIRIELEIEECGSVFADTSQMHQLVMNLCTNAFHAMKDRQGLMKVTLKEVVVGKRLSAELDNVPQGDYVMLEVSDTGQGMDDETMTRVFEPYFTTKKKGEGTGLGLATVHGIVRGHGGGISLRSKEGTGSTIRVYLPVVEGEPSPLKGEFDGANMPELSGMVMFVDDVEFNVQLGQHVCERLGCEVHGYINSLEALSAFKKSPEQFDVVITDQTMPDLTGIEMAKEMMAVRHDIPIILVTGHSHVVDERKAKEAGVREFIMKPLKIDVLAEAIKKVLP